MSQGIFDTIDPFNTNGIELVEILTSFKDAVISGQSGVARPDEIDGGGTWVDTSNEAGPAYIWILKLWTGVIDIPLFVMNINSGVVTTAGGVAVTTDPDSIYGTDGSGDPALYSLAFLRNEIDAAIAALAINWAAADIFHKDISADSTFTFTGLADGKRIRVVIKNTDAANKTCTFPGGIVYEEGFTGLVKAGATKVFTFIRSNGITVGLTGGGGGTTVPSGVVDLSSAATQVVITFATAFPDTNYSIGHSFQNSSDSEPTYIGAILTAKSTSGFTMKFSIATDTANYKFNWTATPFTP